MNYVETRYLASHIKKTQSIASLQIKKMTQSIASLQTKKDAKYCVSTNQKRDAKYRVSTIQLLKLHRIRPFEIIA